MHDVFDFYSASQKQQFLLQISQDGRFSFKDASDILDDPNINLRAQLPQSIQDLLGRPTVAASAQASSSSQASSSAQASTSARASSSAQARSGTTRPAPSSQDQEVIPPLGLIFWRTEEEESAPGRRWIATMAMDRILRHLNRAPFSRYPQGQEIPDDTWAIYLQLDLLKHHVEDPRSNTSPLTTALCASTRPNACKARVVHFPYTKAHKPSDNLHNHCSLEPAGAEGSRKRSWKWVSAPSTLETRYSLETLLELPAEAVRYYWFRAREHNDQQFWFTLLDWDASRQAGGTRKRPRSG